jgi:large subunit ribosomal protein L25
MAAGRNTLKAAARTEFGSRESRRLRRSGQVPGVVYTGGEDARPFQVSDRDLRTILISGQALFDLEIEGQSAVPVVIKEQQHHPVRGNVEHIDLVQVRLDEKIQADVPIELEGAEDAPGAKEGGVLEHITREITVEALPTDIPERIVVDVSEMDVNDTIQLSSIAAPAGAEFVADEPEEVTIVTLTPPRLEAELEAIEEEAALVGEEGEEGEEAAEEAEEGAEGATAEEAEEAAEGDGGGEGEQSSEE